MTSDHYKDMSEEAEDEDLRPFLQYRNRDFMRSHCFTGTTCERTLYSPMQRKLMTALRTDTHDF